jgi:flagellar basal body P-ring formation protein FlgA
MGILTSPSPAGRAPGRGRAAVLAAAFALASVLASPPASAGPTEELMAAEVSSLLGPALPEDARVTVNLAAPFQGEVEAVRDFSYDPRTGQIRALVQSGGRLFDIAGTAEVQVDVPVPVRRVAPGEILSEADLTTVPMPAHRLSAGTVASVAELVGLASRRQLAPGRLIQASSVGAPIVVERNRPVTLVYELGGLFLSAEARALQDGGVGDTVKVMNPSSNSVVSGLVTGPQTVAVGR